MAPPARVRPSAFRPPACLSSFGKPNACSHLCPSHRHNQANGQEGEGGPPREFITWSGYTERGPEESVLSGGSSGPRMAMLILFRRMVLTQGWFCPQGTSDWSEDFLVVRAVGRKRMLLAYTGERPDMLRKILQRPGQASPQSTGPRWH